MYVILGVYVIFCGTYCEYGISIHISKNLLKKKQLI